MATPGSYVPTVLQPVVVPMGYSDPNRNDKCWPSQPIAAAKFDKDKLACYYKCHCFTESADVVSRTLLDVYPQGIMINTPKGCLCCSCDNQHFLYYDDEFFTNDPVHGGCMCSPFPYLCTNIFDLCGEVLVFRRGFFGCPRVGFHSHTAVALCLFPINVLLGLAPGEGDRITAIIKEQKANFDKRSGKHPAPVAGGAGGFGSQSGGLATPLVSTQV